MDIWNILKSYVGSKFKMNNSDEYIATYYTDLTAIKSKYTTTTIYASSPSNAVAQAIEQAGSMNGTLVRVECTVNNIIYNDPSFKKGFIE